MDDVWQPVMATQVLPVNHSFLCISQRIVRLIAAADGGVEAAVSASEWSLKPVASVLSAPRELDIVRQVAAQNELLEKLQSSIGCNAASIYCDWPTNGCRRHTHAAIFSKINILDVVSDFVYVLSTLNI